MAFIEDSAPQKKCRQTIKHENFLRHWLLQTPGEIKIKESKYNSHLNFARGINYIYNDDI
jgi:hypothetical protein